MWMRRAPLLSTRVQKPARPSPCSACAIPFSFKPTTPRCWPTKARRKKSRNWSPNLPPRRNTGSSFEPRALVSGVRFPVRSAEHEIKLTSALRRVFHTDAAAMRHHNFAREGKAKTGASLGLSGHAKKPVEDAIVKILRDARPAVDDAELDFAVTRPPRFQDNFRAGR